MRKLVTAGATGVLGVALVLSLTACGGSSRASAADQVLRHQADMYEIDQIEKTWHRATSAKDIDLLMSLWAPGGTFTTGPGRTLTGKAAIRRFYLNETGPFQPGNHWISETPAYKIRITVNGDKGTLYFECHFVDPKTREVTSAVAGNLDVARIGGRWLITKDVGGPVALRP